MNGPATSILLQNEHAWPLRIIGVIPDKDGCRQPIDSVAHAYRVRSKLLVAVQRDARTLPRLTRARTRCKVLLKSLPPSLRTIVCLATLPGRPPDELVRRPPHRIVAQQPVAAGNRPAGPNPGLVEAGRRHHRVVLVALPMVNLHVPSDEIGALNARVGACEQLQPGTADKGPHEPADGLGLTAQAGASSGRGGIAERLAGRAARACVLGSTIPSRGAADLMDTYLWIPLAVAPERRAPPYGAIGRLRKAT